MCGQAETISYTDGRVYTTAPRLWRWGSVRPEKVMYHVISCGYHIDGLRIGAEGYEDEYRDILPFELCKALHMADRAIRLGTMGLAMQTQIYLPRCWSTHMCLQGYDFSSCSISVPR